MPPLPADFIHARACKLKCEKILTRPFFLNSINRDLASAINLLSNGEFENQKPSACYNTTRSKLWK